MFTHEEYASMLAKTTTEIEKLGRLKGGEYAGDLDRLANFRRNSEAIGLPMEAIWHTYAAKHWDVLTQSIKDQLAGKERVRLEGLEGRCDDLIVYLILFKCMLAERNRPDRSKTYADASISVALRDLVWDILQRHPNAGTHFDTLTHETRRPDALIEECLRRMRDAGKVVCNNSGLWFAVENK